MGLLSWIVLGLVAGAIAKTIHRGAAPGGVFGTFAVGVAGAVLGGMIASTVGIGSVESLFSLGTWIIAILAALLLLLVYNLLAAGGRRAPRTP